MGNIKDLTKKRFGRLIALAPTDKRKDNKIIWRCVCDCGNVCEVISSNLTRGITRSCGCLHREVISETHKIDITNCCFGRLTVLEPTNRRSRGSIVWRCLCDCGSVCDISSSSLVHGGTQSCGCLRKEISTEIHKVDLSNQRFGRLITLEPTEKRARGSVIWKCLCDCGTICESSSDGLIQGKIKSCGCLQKEIGKENLKDISNKRFGRLTTLECTDERVGRSAVWKCQCDCGRICRVRSYSLVRGLTQSCGCLYCKGSVYLYIFRSLKTGFTKIGISSNVIKRKNVLEETLQDSFELLHYRLSSRSEENTIHKQLKQYRAIHPNQPRGKEWFKIDDSLVEILRDGGEIK